MFELFIRILCSNRIYNYYQPKRKPSIFYGLWMDRSIIIPITYYGRIGSNPIFNKPDVSRSLLFRRSWRIR